MKTLPRSLMITTAFGMESIQRSNLQWRRRKWQWELIEKREPESGILDRLESQGNDNSIHSKRTCKQQLTSLLERGEVFNTIHLCCRFQKHDPIICAWLNHQTLQVDGLSGKVERVFSVENVTLMLHKAGGTERLGVALFAWKRQFPFTLDGACVLELV